MVPVNKIIEVITEGAALGYLALIGEVRLTKLGVRFVSLLPLGDSPSSLRFGKLAVPASATLLARGDHRVRLG